VVGLLLTFSGLQRNTMGGDVGRKLQLTRTLVDCLRSMEIGSGASQPPPREASMSDATRLSERMEKGFYYIINQASIGREGAC
jgi:hypothetical protein